MAQMICSEAKQASQTEGDTQQQRIETAPVLPVLRAPEEDIVPSDISLTKRMTDVLYGMRPALAGKSPDEIKQMMEAEGVIRRDDFHKVVRYPKDLLLCQNGKSYVLYDAKEENIRVFDVKDRTCQRTIPLVFTDGFRFDDFLEWTNPYLNDDFLLIEGVAVDETEALETQLFLYDLRDGQVKNIVPQSILDEAMTESGDKSPNIDFLVYHLPEKSVSSSRKGSFTFYVLILDEQQNVRTLFCRYSAEKGASEVFKTFPFLIKDAQMTDEGEIEAFVQLSKYEEDPEGIRTSIKSYEAYEMREGEPQLIRKVCSRNAPNLHYDRSILQLPVLTCRALYNGYMVPVVLNPADENAKTYLPQREIAGLESDVRSFLVNPRDPTDIIWYSTRYEEEFLHVKLESGSFLNIKADEIHINSLFRDRPFLSRLVERLNISRPHVFNMSTKLCHQYFLLSPGTEESPVRFDLLYSKHVFEDLAPEICLKCSVPKSFTFKARDGLYIQGYLTLPVKKEAINLPALLMVHGGPAKRDRLRLEYDVQAWASRGFAVVQINFRGSSGFGEKFEGAGNGERNHAMTNDLIDGLSYLSQKGTIDQKRMVAIGVSYGAFAVVSCLTQYPGLFTCGVAVNGTYDLVKNFQALKNQALYKYYAKSYGVTLLEDNRLSEADLEKLRQSSPYHSLDRLTKPLLLITGDLDEVCDPQQSSQIFKKAKELGKTVCHVYFKDEGHQLTADAQRRAFGFSENFVHHYMPDIFAETVSADFAKEKTAHIIRSTL